MPHPGNVLLVHFLHPLPLYPLADPFKVTSLQPDEAGHWNNNNNFCIALFSGVRKLIALYNILQHFVSERKKSLLLHASTDLEWHKTNFHSRSVESELRSSVKVEVDVLGSRS